MRYCQVPLSSANRRRRFSASKKFEKVLNDIDMTSPILLLQQDLSYFSISIILVTDNHGRQRLSNTFTKATAYRVTDRDKGKYTDISKCDYLVDSTSSSFSASVNERDFIREAKEAAGEKGEWETIACRAFLDVGATHVLARTIWVPDLPFVPGSFRRRWGEYCLLKRR
jgi:hypothetical protein